MSKLVHIQLILTSPNLDLLLSSKDQRVTRYAGDKIKFTPKFLPHQNQRDLMPKSLQAVIDDEDKNGRLLI